MPKTSDKILEILQRLEKKVDNLQDKINNIEQQLQNSNTGKKITLKKTPKSSKKKVVIKNGNVTITKHPNGIIVTGDTYDKRGVIKKNGGWWTPSVKGWTVRLNRYEEIKSELKLMSKNLTEKISEEELEIEDKISMNETQKPQIEEYEFIDDD